MVKTEQWQKSNIERQQRSAVAVTAAATTTEAIRRQSIRLLNSCLTLLGLDFEIVFYKICKLKLQMCNQPLTTTSVEQKIDFFRLVQQLHYV